MNKTGKGLSRIRIWQIIVAIGVVVGIIGSGITIYEFLSSFRDGSGGGVTVTATVSPSTPTGIGTPTPTFTGTGSGNTPPYTFTGKGSEKMTHAFRVGTNWSMKVSCIASPPLKPGQFEIDVVDNSDGMIISGPIDVEVCAGSGTTEKVPENQGGTFYLQITARDDISWTILIS